MKPIRWFTVALLFGVSGCSLTTFENPPLANSSCDTRLIGDWFWDTSTKPTLANGLELQVDKDCSSLSAIQHDDQGMQFPHGPIALHLGSLGKQSYAWIDLSAMGFDSSPKTPKSPNDIDIPIGAKDVPVKGYYLVRYEIHDKVLMLYPTEDRAIAHRIINGTLRGDVIMREFKPFTTLYNNINSEMPLDQFRRDISFVSRPWRFSHDKK